MAGITEMHAQFWREDGERLETENTEPDRNAKLRAALAGHAGETHPPNWRT